MSAVTYKKGKLYNLPIIDLKPDPSQPRKFMDPKALEELVASIKTHGIIQPILFRVGIGGHDAGIGGHDPISPEIGIVSPDSVPPGIVSPDSVPGETGGHDAASCPPISPGTVFPIDLIIVAGERRYKAAQQAGLTTLPGICVEGNPSEIALIENMLRQDLTPVEEAEGLLALMTEQKYTQVQLGSIIGKAQNTLSEILSLNKLPPKVRDDCRGDRTISKNALITIAKKKQARGMTTAYIAYKAKLQKGKTIRQKKNPNKPQAAFDMMDKALTKIRSIDMSAWTDDDKSSFQASLASLKTEIENYLSPAPRLA